MSTERHLQFAAALAAEMGLPGVKRAAAEGISALLEATGATVFVWDAARGKLTFDAVSGPASTELTQCELDVGQGIAGRVAASRTAVLHTDTQGAGQVDRSFDARSGFQTASLIAVPLVCAGELVGVLEAVRDSGRPAFTAEALATLGSLAPFVAAAVQHTRLRAAEAAAKDDVLKSNAELERRVAERTLQIARGKQEWEATFDAILDPISLQDGFTIRRANLEYARRANMRIQDVVGKKCHKVLAGRDEPCIGCPLVSGTDRPAELTARDQRFQATAYPLPSTDAPRRVVLSYRDVTEQRSLEERLKQSEKLASIGQLANGAAHEINNPLAFMMSNVVTLKAEVTEAKAAIVKARGNAEANEWVEMLDDTLTGARRIADIVKHLQLLVSPGNLKYERAVANDPVRRAVVAVAGEKHQVKLDLRSEMTLETAPGRLQRALEHVLRNATQAVKHESAITVSTRDESGGVVIRVEDSGVGIPSEVLPHVFEPFFTTRGVGQGTGLGLTAAWGIVEQLGGRISIASTQGEGTSVVVHLPKVSPTTSRAAPTVGRYASRGDLS